jgi:Zn-dependent M16 (insulinase) family peptidase
MARKIGEFIRSLNVADKCVREYKAGETTADELFEYLVSVGFYNINIDPETKKVSASITGIGLELGVVNA